MLPQFVRGACDLPLQYFKRLVSSFGARYLSFIFFGQHLLKGYVAGGGSGGIAMAVAMYLFRARNVDSEDLVVYMAICMSPWTLKPLIGMVTDSGLIKKKQYFGLAASVLSIVACAVISFGSSGLSNGALAVAFMFVFLQVAWIDLLAEGATASMMRHSKEEAADLLSYTWYGINIMSIVGLAVAGPGIDRHESDPQVVMLACLPGVVLVIPPLLLNWLGRRRPGVTIVSPMGAVPQGSAASGVKRNGDSAAAAAAAPSRPSFSADALDADEFERQLEEFVSEGEGGRRSGASQSDAGGASCCLPAGVGPSAPDETNERALVYASAILACGVVFVVAVGLATTDTVLKLQVVTVVSLICIGVSGASIPARVFYPMLYEFLSKAMGFNLGSVIFYFYTDPYRVCPTCPHFSAVFYQTVILVVDNIFGVVGVFLFHRFLSRTTYRRAILIPSVFGVLMGFVDVLQFSRLVSPDPIPDEVLALGRNAMEQTLAIMTFMVNTTLISRLCPPDKEITLFALLSGFSNFGMMVSAYTGSYLIHVTGLGGIDGEGTDDFSRLWWVVVIAMAGDVASLFLVPLLLPDANIDEPAEVLELFYKPDTGDGGGANRVLLSEVIAEHGGRGGEGRAPSPPPPSS